MNFIQKIAILLVTFMSLAISLDESEIYLIKGGPYDSRTVQDCDDRGWCYLTDNRKMLMFYDLTIKGCYTSYSFQSIQNGFRCQETGIEFLAISKMMIPVRVKVSESSGEFGAVLDLNLKIDKASLGY